ncbi:hypothetical protein GCM10009837_23360 [Streptomyces durmitorensis]
MQAEAHRLIADALTAQRSLAVWAGKGTQPPPWKVDSADVVVGTVRVPLTVATLAEWMQGEGDDDA